LIARLSLTAALAAASPSAAADGAARAHGDRALAALKSGGHYGLMRLAALVSEPIRTPSVLLVTHHDNIAALTRIDTREGEDRRGEAEGRRQVRGGRPYPARRARRVSQRWSRGREKRSPRRHEDHEDGNYMRQRRA